SKAVIPNVQHVGAGDAVGLTTEFDDLVVKEGGWGGEEDARVEFSTTIVKVDQDAEEHMRKYFPKLTPTPSAVVCIGKMQISNIVFEGGTDTNDGSGDDDGF
ncbi:hypothetical protein HK104_007538, partial [Borealophlyctis nickersoniae]